MFKVEMEKNEGKTIIKAMLIMKTISKNLHFWLFASQWSTCVSLDKYRMQIPGNLPGKYCSHWRSHGRGTLGLLPAPGDHCKIVAIPVVIIVVTAITPYSALTCHSLVRPHAHNTDKNMTRNY